MDKAGTGPFISGKEPTMSRSKIDIGDSSIMVSDPRPELIPDRDDVQHYDIWIPLDNSDCPKKVIVCKSWRD